jgi:uncharacterized protein YndB with AHSA1/START domain
MEHELSLTRVLAASAEDIYDAWLDPRAVAEWMRPIPSGHTEASCDPRVGGSFLITMHGNGTRYPTRGEYLRLERPHLLEFTWHPDGDERWKSIVSVTLRELGAGRTELTLRHRRFPSADMADGHREGWSRGLDSLAAWLVARTP